MKRIAVALLSLGCCAAQQLLKVTGTFTNLRAGTEDILGAEFTIVLGGSGYYVIAQCSEGFPGIPEVARAFIEGNRLMFTLEEDTRSGCPNKTYKGVISPEGLRGKFDGLYDDWPGFLKRGRSYWQ